jgi:hypothetical protein
VLPHGLPDRPANDDLEELIVAQARGARGGEVLVGDVPGALGDLLDERSEGLVEP